MASSSAPASPPDISGISQDNEERTHYLQCPPGPENKVDPQAILKKRVMRKQPSVQHLKARGQMIFPGWHTQSPSAQAKKREPESVHRVPEPQCSTIPPRSLIKHPKVVGKRSVDLKKNSLQHIKDRKQTFSPDRHTQLTTGLEKNNSNNIEDLISSLFEDQPLLATSQHLAEDEYHQFCEPLCIVPLSFQKIWKCFCIWRTKVYKKKVYLTKTYLQNHLFVMDPCLGPALMEIRKLSCQLIDKELHHVKTNHSYTLKEFLDSQLKQQQEIMEDIQPFRDTVKDVAVCAGREYMLDHHVTPAEHFDSDKINSFVLNRVVCFIRYVDHFIFSTVNCLLRHVVHGLLTVFQNQVGLMPSQIAPQTQSDHSEAVSKEDAEKKVVPDLPLFKCELVLESNVLMYKPSEENIQETIEEIVRQCKKTVMSLRSLTSDPEINSLKKSEHFQHLKCNRISDPSLNMVLEEDGRLRRTMHSIRDSLHFAFESAQVYSHTFDHFLAFSKSNETMDLDAVWQQEPDLTFFAKTLELYHNKHKQAIAIQEKRHLGLLLVDQTQLKLKLVSSTLSSLEGFYEMLTQQARKKVDVLLAKVGGAKSKLKCSPSTTAEMAEQLLFLDEIEARILEVQEEHDNVSKVYNLFNAYSVTIPPEDLSDFASLQPTINSLCNLIEDAVAERDSKKERFMSSLVSDQNKLQKEVTKLARVLQNQDFLDVNANSSKVRPLLEEIQITVDELQALAFSCNLYERKFKLESTRLDSLEESTARFRLILLLWNSVEEWDYLQNEWQQTPLKQLDLKQLSLHISSYNQHVEQLETGLPLNCSVALKDKVERMTQKLPVISNVCNLCMKPGLWVSFESLLGTSLDVEAVTLATLEEYDVFSYAMKILELLT
ncbi:dynein heavy chain 6, axonemal isoform X1 [Fundulus heteroclitus]|uniref:dynein heavy chain 6, axonemal isoform X1 n=2 Tax=Fundulus heteroclitus TaxID=8078 RepID=UPI00165A2C46|nr:dynein heavy chain 6, axonemal isoform X1 [Fundulus heteroclitus]